MANSLGCNKLAGNPVQFDQSKATANVFRIAVDKLCGGDRSRFRAKRRGHVWPKIASRWWKLDFGTERQL